MDVSELTPWIADALVVFGVGIMTIGVYGVFRMPDVYLQLHAASKAVFLGVIMLALATFVTGQTAIIYRVILISVVLLLTTPVSAHTIAFAAHLKGEQMASPDAFDESADQRPAGASGPGAVHGV
jgi:multicomponent Na+:H+ antiporter subunit G